MSLLDLFIQCPFNRTACKRASLSPCPPLQELPDKPVTTVCSHNVCLACLKRAFKADYTKCPSCRTELKDEPQDVNTDLQAALEKIFPGYSLGR